MASASVLQRLTVRAKQAEEIIFSLKSQIESVKQAAAVSASKGEEEKLRLENKVLRDQIESLKVKLTLAEIKNGATFEIATYELGSLRRRLNASAESINPGQPAHNSIVKQVQLPVKRKLNENVTVNAETNAVTEPPMGPEESKPAKQKNESDKKKTAKGQKGDADKPSDSSKPAKGKGGGKKGGEAELDIDISRMDLRVGKIVEVTRHPDAEKLYMETVELGEAKPRTILSGLVDHVPIEQMQDRVAVFMCNLKPAKMRGIMSEGMIMCATSPDKAEILVPPPGSEIGDKVICKDFPGTPDALLNPKKKVWETVKPDLLTNQDKVACYKGSPLEVEGKGFLKAPTLPNTQIS